MQSSVLDAQPDSYVRFSPTVGDTLDAVERERLDLFPQVDDFQWAVFLLQEGGSVLKAKVCSIRDGRIRLQIINMGITAEFLRKKIEQEFGQKIQVSVHAVKPRHAELNVTRCGTRDPSRDSVLLLSPMVGHEIDPAERDRLGLFLNLKGFRRAVFFRSSEATYYAMVTLLRDEGSLVDSCIELYEQDLLKVTERINRQSRVHIDSLRRNLLPDDLPLTGNPMGLSRPLFPTVHLDIGIGLSFPDFSGAPNPGSNSVAFPASLFLHLPMYEDPSIAFVGGWGAALGGVNGGRLTTFSATLVFQTSRMFFPFEPVLGIGMARSVYSYEGSLIIHAGVSYPVFLLGANLGSGFKLIVTLPVSKTLHTTFEGGSYSINPAGPSLGLHFCL